MKKSIFAFAILAGCGGVALTGDAGTDAGDAAVDAPPPGGAITGLTPGSWTWVDFPGAQCRDGTATGIGVSPSASGSTKLMIFFEGGGACFNAATCGANPAHYDKNTFMIQ